MTKRIIAVWVFLLVLISSVFADDYLLMRSIQTSTYEELVRMSDAYGLDSSLEVSDLRCSLLEFFDLSDEQEEIEVSESYKTNAITIDSSDSLYSSDSAVILSGNVCLSFKIDSEDQARTLVAQKVVVDIDSKRIEATGDVCLDAGSDSERTFEGQAVVLDWSNLDIVVFDGISSTSRKNASGTEILFFASGERISYSGETSTILFRNGTISTTLEDPYWSISAGKISFTDSDLFFDSAVFRLGRVPIFYIPVFFYPGTTLSFNPAMGFSSDKGAFLNTTTEIYGKYPGLGINGTPDSDDADVSASIVSLLSTDEEGETIRDGIYYRRLEEGEELGELESWARSTSSYMAIFADAYENQGLVLGIDTVNKLFSNKVNISATGAMGYRSVAPSSDLGRFRYALNFNFLYSDSGLKVDASLPVLSDPYAKVDYLNRNTVFGLDSVFGSSQNFPKTYSSQTTYTWSANASYSKSLGRYSFNLSSLKADIDYKLERISEAGEAHYESTVVEASLPYLSFNTSGTFLELSTDSKTVTTDTGYSNDLAKDFENERLSLASDSSEMASDVEGLKYYSGPDLNLTQTSISQGAGLKMGYTFYQTMDNIYIDEMIHDRFYTKINGSFYVNASAPDSWFSVTETLKPNFSFSDNDINKASSNRTEDLSLVSSLDASIPKFGIRYVLTQKMYNYNSKTTDSLSESTSSIASWDKDSVTEHYLNASKSFGIYTIGLYLQFKPLTEIIKPSAGFSLNGFRASANFSFERKDVSFEKGEGNLDLSYSSQVFKFALSNHYDFSESSWNGYSLAQSSELNIRKNLVLSENSEFVGRFELKTLKFNATYKLDTEYLNLNGSATMKFKGQRVEKDSLLLTLKASSAGLYFWKSRVYTNIQTNLSFNYDFQNPYKSSLSASLNYSFSLAEFLDLGLSVTSSNKSFSRYYNSGTFVFDDMWQDLIKSFDFFGNGRKNTGFNLSSFKLSIVHYMRDWNLYIDAEGKLTTQYSGKYEWVPQVTVCVKWNALPELKVESSWDSYNREWK